MLKMLIRFNGEKIEVDNKYDADKLQKAIDDILKKMGFPRIEDTSGALVYCDSGHASDYARFGKIVNTLKKQSWFINNVDEWFLFDNDDSENSNDFNKEDLLVHYRKK